MYRLPTIVIQFDNEIDSTAIPLFRGAVIASQEEKNILFHNHDGDGLRYSYPLIQYKRIQRKAAVMGIGKGVEVVSQLLNAHDFNFQIGKEKVEMKIRSVEVHDNEIALSSEPQYSYHLRNWFPLNAENYARYRAAESLIERIAILERVLTGNILSFLKGTDIRIEEPIGIQITDIIGLHGATYKKVRLAALDIEFKTNIDLPQYIGLGKSTSVGHGVLTKIA